MKNEEKKKRTGKKFILTPDQKKLIQKYGVPFIPKSKKGDEQ